jgi:hypothetical protein
MTIVEISADGDEVPIRIELLAVSAVAATDVYAGRDTRIVPKVAVKAVVKTTEQIYQEAIAMACTAAAQTAQRLAEMSEEARPDEFEVRFGLSLGAGMDTKIVNASSGAEVLVRMQWNRSAGD